LSQEQLEPQLHLSEEEQPQLPMLTRVMVVCIVGFCGLKIGFKGRMVEWMTDVMMSKEMGAEVLLLYTVLRDLCGTLLPLMAEVSVRTSRSGRVAPHGHGSLLLAYFCGEIAQYS
jgi:hypothetical protein